MSISCIIIEDEPAASDLLERYLAQCPDMRCEGAFPDAFAALAWLEHHTVDLIFLDINLPGLSGIGFLKALPATGPAPQSRGHGLPRTGMKPPQARASIGPFSSPCPREESVIRSGSPLKAGSRTHRFR